MRIRCPPATAFATGYALAPRRQVDVGRHLLVFQIGLDAKRHLAGLRRRLLDDDLLAVFQPAPRRCEAQPQRIGPAVIIRIVILHQQIAELQ